MNYGLYSGNGNVSSWVSIQFTIPIWYLIWFPLWRSWSRSWSRTNTEWQWQSRSWALQLSTSEENPNRMTMKILMYVRVHLNYRCVQFRYGKNCSRLLVRVILRWGLFRFSSYGMDNGLCWSWMLREIKNLEWNCEREIIGTFGKRYIFSTTTSTKSHYFLRQNVDFHCIRAVDDLMLFNTWHNFHVFI